MWRKETENFPYGKNDHDKAEKAARACCSYKADDEDEWVSDDPVSCYNCRYRRWTEDSFKCMKKG